MVAGTHLDNLFGIAAALEFLNWNVQFMKTMEFIYWNKAFIRPLVYGRPMELIVSDELPNVTHNSSAALAIEF